MNIGEEPLATFDLYLLVAFMAVYQAGSVTLAANKLHVGQPAVSHSLARLRTLFNDPLFVRSGNGVNPTPKAQQIAEGLDPALRRIEHVLTSSLA